jgi:hypothetical protein
MNSLKKYQLLVPIAIGLVFFGLALLRPKKYAAETTFFVPLTLLERQIQQNGIGFGSPSEVDAHLELLKSQVVTAVLKEQYGDGFELDISKTRNGAVKVVATTSTPETAAQLANQTVAIADSIKQDMLRQNVGQSLAFVSAKTRELTLEEALSRAKLDSIRLLAKQDSVAFAALEFRQEQAYGFIVSELTHSERKMLELDRYLKAPAPASYVLSRALAPQQPSGIPAWAIALLAAGLSAVALYLLRTYAAKS